MYEYNQLRHIIGVLVLWIQQDNIPFKWFPNQFLSYSTLCNFIVLYKYTLEVVQRRMNLLHKRNPYSISQY